MIRKNSKLWDYLAKESDSPASFLRSAMRIQGVTAEQMGKESGTTRDNVNMYTYKGTKHLPGTELCLRFATQLNLDPFILNRLVADYKMKKLIESQNGIQ